MKQTDNMDKNDTNNKAPIEPPAFATLVHSITHSALLEMGMIPQMKNKKNKALAEFNIELLILLRKKTKGNLTEEEKQLMDNCIQDLQLTFAQQMNTETK